MNTDVLAPATKFCTTKADEAVKIQFGESELESLKPKTIMTVVEETVNKLPNKLAIGLLLIH